MTNTDSSETSARTARRRRNVILSRVVAASLLLLIAILKPTVDEWLAGERTLPEHGEVSNSTGDVQILPSETDASPPTSPDRHSPGHDKGDSGPKPQVSNDRGDTVSILPRSESPGSDSPQTGAPQAVPKIESPPAAKRVDEDSSSVQEQDPPGKLSLVSGTRDVFKSTAGLLYVPGSADGHRLKHVLKHAKDDPGKPVHGVFDGDRDRILAWIDTAFEKGQKGGKGVRRETDNDRTVFTVDLDEKIGFVGGTVGKRKNHPPCRYLRIVIEDGNKVVTAYPSDRL